MKTNVRRTGQLGWMVAGALLLGTGQAAVAKKPVKPPPEPEPPMDTGVVYADIEGDVVALAPDGSGEQYLFTLPADISAMDVEASRLTHDGERWFVAWQFLRDEYYPDGATPRSRLVAMSEAGETVILHDDPMLQRGSGNHGPRWVPGDTAVSWPALRWEGDTIVEWGIYSLDVAFVDGVCVPVGDPGVVDWTRGLFELWYEPPGTPYQPGWYLLVNDFDWSPDGGAIVYSACYSEAFDVRLYVADADGSVRQLTDDIDTYPQTPRWSPDGTRIVFQLNGQHQLDVIGADGSGRQALVTTSRTDDREMVFLPRWSPASTHVVYCYFTAGPRRIWAKDALHIVAADGTGDTVLTGACMFTHPLGWRPE